jgi:hypothetical protein
MKFNSQLVQCWKIKLEKNPIKNKIQKITW